MCMRIRYDNPLQNPEKPRVLTVAPLPPERCAYALARYSRSPDSIRDSIEWVRTHDSTKFLESFYFQYGHASIADLGHVVLCFEGVSEIAATEIEDEQLWDGQARSSRYQNFSTGGFVTPEPFSEDEASRYRAAGKALLEAYQDVHARVLDHLTRKLPRPESMKEDAYRRNLTARAFDVARYLLFLGIPTGVGQVTSIRTLESQIRRLKGSVYDEVRALGRMAAEACAAPPAVKWREDEPDEPIAPTLARYVDRDPYPGQARASLRAWAIANLPPARGVGAKMVDLVQPKELLPDIAATLLYPVTDRSFRELYQEILGWSRARQAEVLEVAVGARGERDELIREFRGGLFSFDLVMDTGGYRDLHRHRRCQQFRQAPTTRLGYDTPAAMEEAGLSETYHSAIRAALEVYETLPAPSGHYLLPFAVRGRFLFKMDFAEAEYICRLRSGIKGHFSYRNVAWLMKRAIEQAEPELGRLIQATPPWVEDPLVR